MRWTIAALTLLVTACPGPSTGTQPTTPTFDSDRALMTIPAPPDAAGAIQRMATRADGGDTAAAWARAHYLVDLFDDARFRRDDSSLRLLGEAMGLADGDLERGAEATGRALDFLLLQIDAVLAADRLHGGAQAARTMLEFESRPPTARHQLFQRMLELKSVARSAGPMADNAVLRMAGFCREALVDAVSRAWSERMRTVAHCLYPLYDSDPAPYFDADPAAQPPPPAIGDLLDDLDALLAPVTKRGGRLEFAAIYLVEQLDEFAWTGATELPAVPERGSLGLPTVDSAPAYDWTPVIAIGDGSQMPSVDELTEALTAEVAGDARATVAVAASADAPATSLLAVSEAALRTGATRVELVAWTEQTLSVPRGDYWHDRIDGDTAPRLAVLPISLAVLAGHGETKPGDPAAQQRWDPSLATLGVHLVVSRDQWRLVAPTGELAAIPATDADAPERDLRIELERLRSAFGSEGGLVVVPAEGATMGMLIAAVAAAYRDDAGHASFTRIALAETAPVAASDTLAGRVARRSRAIVTITPAELATRTAVVRACYQSILETAPKTSASITVTAASDKIVIDDKKVGAKVRTCVIEGIGALMKVHEIASATVVLSPS